MKHDAVVLQAQRADQRERDGKTGFVMTEQRTEPMQDFVVVGGGLAGLTMALALKRTFSGQLKVALVDPYGLDPLPASGRAYAIAAGACKMFQALGVWDHIAPSAQPIERMVITDSRLSEPVRPVFLTFDTPHPGDEPYAYMIEQDDLLRSLQTALSDTDLCVFKTRASRFESHAPEAVLDLEAGPSIATRLVIACDGARSPLRQAAGIGMIVHAYDQSGIVATLGLERDHHGVAEEHFLPSGPFATLPLSGRRCSIVWTERNAAVKTYLSMAPDEFVAEVEQRFGLRYGALTLLDKPQAFPLRVGLAREFVKPRLALVGDAAHLVHPISGQGLNLGLRDVAALAETLINALRLGLDCGRLTVLQDYESARRFDTLVMAGLTDTLNRLFSNDLTPLRLLRDLGLGLVDRMPSLKELLIREAAIRNPAAPKLMQGVWP
jgi:2-octaprenyl-6-methoxyphenol hydroxylase